MRVRYNEKKATQIAAHILREFGGQMDLLDLMKIIYAIDRTALLKLRWPMTGDRYSALPKGMILSRTYDLAKDEDYVMPTFWEQFIRRGDGFAVSLTADPGRDELSDVELRVIGDTLGFLKTLSRRELIEEIHHKYPEWRDPQGSSFTVMYEEVLEKEGWDAEKISTLSEQMEIHSQFECAV